MAAVPIFIPSGNDVNDDDVNELAKLFPVLKSNAGKLVSPLECHACVKFTLLALVPSFAPLGNDVRAEQFRHAPEKLVPLLIFSAGKLFSDTQLYHVLIKEEPAEVFSNGKLVRL